ncbi:unnamed protein product [Ilex paraguariensis]|uniref:SKP1 component POZ domain-containing protein n=1 Tax=Ilex paraguariensis TaxID=185542 RepID=A0ABC8RMF2_9AQUA
MGRSTRLRLWLSMEALTIKHMIEDDCADTVIPLPNVTSRILSKVIEYCKKHVEVPKSKDPVTRFALETFDAEFPKVELDTLFDPIMQQI